MDMMIKCLFSVRDTPLPKQFECRILLISTTSLRQQSPMLTIVIDRTESNFYIDFFSPPPGS